MESVSSLPVVLYTDRVICIYNLFQKVNKLPHFTTEVAEWGSHFPNPQPHVSFCSAFSVHFKEYGVGTISEKTCSWDDEGPGAAGAHVILIDAMDSEGSFPINRQQPASI